MNAKTGKCAWMSNILPKSKIVNHKQLSNCKKGIIQLSTWQERLKTRIEELFDIPVT